MLVRAGLCALALAVAAPSGAAAQFTTVVRPPERQAAAAEAASAARSDSAATLQIVSMQQWVDSVAAEAAAEGDTIVAVESTGDVVTDSAALAARPEESTLRYASGAPAPDTATPLPLVALVGLLAAGIGGALLYRPRA